SRIPYSVWVGKWEACPSPPFRGKAAALRDDRHEIGAGLYELPDAQGPVSHHSVHRRRDRGVTQIQFRLLCDGPLLLQRSIRLLQLRAQDLGLNLSGPQRSL